MNIYIYIYIYIYIDLRGAPAAGRECATAGGRAAYEDPGRVAGWLDDVT